ncbi:MAG: winged helix-turn-helix transcriptional regulator [Archangiaceae bacterium]|nr:winged helix-turn-helix transcriptional regulator [Archangiaceae bacterium]
MSLRVDRCRCCGSPVLWALTTFGRSFMLNATPVDDGAYVLEMPPDQVMLPLAHGSRAKLDAETRGAVEASARYNDHDARECLARQRTEQPVPATPPPPKRPDKRAASWLWSPRFNRAALPPRPRLPKPVAAPPSPPRRPRAQLDIDKMLGALHAGHWSVRQLARELGVGKSTIYDHLQRLGVSPPARRSAA